MSLPRVQRFASHAPRAKRRRPGPRPAPPCRLRRQPNHPLVPRPRELAANPVSTRVAPIVPHVRRANIRQAPLHVADAQARAFCSAYRVASRSLKREIPGRLFLTFQPRASHRCACFILWLGTSRARAATKGRVAPTALAASMPQRPGRRRARHAARATTPRRMPPLAQPARLASTRGRDIRRACSVQLGSTCQRLARTLASIALRGNTVPPQAPHRRLHASAAARANTFPQQVSSCAVGDRCSRWGFARDLDTVC